MVRIRVKKPVRATGLSATLVGHEEARFGSGEYVRRAGRRAAEISVQIVGPEELEAGTHERSFRLQIPEDASPSYLGQRCSTRYFLHLHLGLHRWFDRKSRFEVVLSLSKGLSVYPGKPALFASRAGGPEAKKPYLEGSLANDVLAPGDVLRGAVALSNTSYNRYSRIVVALVGTEMLHDKGTREDREVRRLSIDVDTRQAAEGESLVLAMQVPPNLAPSARAQLWSLAWTLEIVAKVRLGRDVALRLPVTVVPPGLERDSGVVRAPPSVGSARMRALWHGVANDLGLEYHGSYMSGMRDEVSLRISREHRGRRGWLVLAQLRFSSLRLGARIEEASLLRGTTFGGLRIGSSKWRKDHHVRSARPAQGQTFFAAIGDALSAFSLVTMDDEELTIGMEDSGLRGARLREFVGASLGLATLVAEARTRIPPPAEFETHASAWQQFAAQLAGRLEPGDMSIRGQLQGITIETEHTWTSDGVLASSILRLRGLVRLADESCYVLESPNDDVLEAADIERRPEEQWPDLEIAALGARRLSCGKDALELVLGPTPAPVVFEKRLPTLMRIAQSRATVAGPYR